MSNALLTKLDCVQIVARNMMHTRARHKKRAELNTSNLFGFTLPSALETGAHRSLRLAI